MSDRPLTPEQVAAYWGCSANHVRRLIHRGELRAFRLGDRLFRIPRDAIGEYEQRQMNDTVFTTDREADSAKSAEDRQKTQGVENGGH